MAITRYINLLLITIASIVVLPSCRTLVSPSDLVFLQETAPESSNVSSIKEYQIQSRDLISVNVVAPQAVDGIGWPSGRVNMPVNPGALYMTNYTVSDSGYINLPTIGNVLVKGKTVGEVEKAVSDKLKKYLTQFSVIVKLMNFRVSVLGEVNRPGMYYFYETKVSVFDAISSAGGFAGFANRAKIKVIRSSGDVIAEFVLDPQSSKIVSEDGFYLSTGDIVYIEPLQAKAANLNRNLVSVVLSAVSIFVTLYSVATR